MVVFLSRGGPGRSRGGIRGPRSASDFQRFMTPAATSALRYPYTQPFRLAPAFMLPRIYLRAGGDGLGFVHQPPPIRIWFGLDLAGESLLDSHRLRQHPGG